MNAAQRTLGLSLALALGFGLIAGCNSLIGADKPNHVASLGGAGGAASTCVLASDCPDAQICVFSQCSKQCAADKDCQFGRCLPTSAGNACVLPDSAACKTNTDCPAGSECIAKDCRTACAGNADCLTDQTCTNGACVGNDATKDPRPGGGGGAGGTPGNGDSGAGGSAGEVGPAGGMSSGGTGGSGGNGGNGGMAGTGGMSDGTAIGTLSAACDKEGALACAGHAQRSQLICQGGAWKTNGTCDGTSFCDTTPGANAGACQPILAECGGKMAGDHVCATTGTDLRECGVDLVTANVVQSCTYVCSGGACTGECHPAAKGCKAGNVIPQVCQDNGTLQDQTACGYQCDPATGKCIAAGCKDNVKNGDETDKDCGGSCSGCPIDGACKVSADCVAPASAHCLNLKCVAATCSDGIKNGDETGPDCGGSCPGHCGVGQGCQGNGDCALPASGHCSGSVCVAASCNDGVLNGTETGQDCGGSCAADCPVGVGCGMDADCASGACLNSKCVVCKPTTKQCVAGPAFQQCSASGDWGSSQPCAVANGTPSCSGGVCGIAACNPGYGDCNSSAPDGCETNLNVATACGTTCGNRVVCSTVNGTPSCNSGVCVMACTGGYGDCGGANDGCETNLNIAANCGTCAHTTSCTVPAFICSSGSCVNNTPYQLGQVSTAGGTEVALPTGVWLVLPVNVPTTATLKEFRFIGGPTTPAGGQARMALWADDGAGHPGAFVVQSAATSITATEVTLLPQTILTLSGGKTYWLGAKFTNGVRAFQIPTSGLNGYQYTQDFATTTTPELSTFKVATSSPLPNVQFNMILYVQTVPP